MDFIRTDIDPIRIRQTPFQYIFLLPVYSFVICTPPVLRSFLCCQKDVYLLLLKLNWIKLDTSSVTFGL